MSGSVRDILRIGGAFCEAQALMTAVELDLFTVLSGAGATEEEIRVRLGLHGRGLGDLLALLTELGLLEESGGVFGNAAGADRYLVRDRPGHVGGFLLGAKANLYPVWDGLAETLRSGKPRSASDNFAAMLDDRQELGRYVAMMEGVLQPLIVPLLEAFDWSAHRSVLDVGGCRGNLAGRLALANTGLAAHVFDLPQMAPLFDEHMAELGATERVRFHAGDFFTGPLPRADVLVFGHILHNWPARQREDLVRKAFDAVNPGGALLVHDRMLDDDRANIDNLMASLIMALVTEEGEEYPIAELAGLARSAGFDAVSHRALDENETLVICHKAA